MEGKIPISLLVFVVGCFTLASAFEDQLETLDADSDLDLDKNPFEYIKKPYRHMTEYKRLPFYTFGLGKRSPSHNFGLGKRYSQEEGITDYDEYPFEEESVEAEPFANGEVVRIPEKRQRSFTFGLGKRLAGYGFGLGKRMEPFEFGLGKRTEKFKFGLGKRTDKFKFGLGKRTDKFKFGLGKRNGFYSFGVGKRASGPSALSDVFGFGLGKRFDDSYSDGSRSKREASSSVSATKNDSEGKDYTLDRDLGKRPKNSVLSSKSFSRQFRKPFSYNFGFGKRNYQNYGHVY